MKANSIKLILLTLLVTSCCLMLANCGDDKVQDSGGPRIVGNLSQAATMLDIVLPADCGNVSDADSPLTGRVNNVDLNAVKIVMYSTSGVFYGHIRVFADDGTFSFVLPCGRRVRLVLADSDWTPPDSLDDGPPDVANSVLATYWDIDRVAGGVSGLVRDAFDNSLVPGVEVSWVISGFAGSSITGANGFFVVGTVVPSGTHGFSFSKTDYAELVHDGVIPPLDDLVREGDSYPGDYPYVENLEVRLPPLSASLSGHVRLIDPVSTDTVAAANVEIQLLLSDRLVTNVMKDTTDANGLYSFEQVPAADTLSMVVPSFVLSAYTYGPVDSTLELFPGSTVIDALLSAGGGGSYRLISEPDRK
ncbi:MAG: Ig-like domain-containing protein [candidate division Zixibacteria bacterium]|nr:Ig-like domain-containing protein [candidate division Zixibacteria bacterium]MDH3938577.1 Ig-like domain-containing protein [candidate division Zixibacteria bacterium]MDH4034800.1 Ig-like domain-containing protein [candidate division Zixibacteria bacterium]